MAAAGIEAAVASLEANHPSIQLHTPGSPRYDELSKTYIITDARAAAIARPQTAQHVQALVRTCLEHKVDFNIRTGGHNCVGRTTVAGALMIDMRDINYVKVSEDRKTAKIGGGVLAGRLLTALGEHGLAAPCGSIATVGYVGWSTLGGYGPFSSLYGPGCDNIVAAELVNAKGDIMTAEADLLEGIRGGGTIFGAIVELTIKVYPLKELLVGTLVYDSSDMDAVWSSLTQGVQALALPDPMNVQPFATDFPGVGKVLGAIVTWVDQDHDEGRKWIDRIASLGTCIMNQTAAKTPSQYAIDNEKLVTYGVHGRPGTLNIKQWTPETARVLAKYSSLLPGGNAMISVHSMRHPPPSHESVFGAREPHHMVEIVSLTSDAALEEETSSWGKALLKELREKDEKNILKSAYIALLDKEDAHLPSVYNKHLDTLVALKAKYDPDNVFKHSAPYVVAE